LLTKPIEQLASQSLGQTVTVKEVHASVWPQPHISLKNVTIGNTNIDTLEVIPEIVTLFKPIKTIKSFEINGLNIGQKSIVEPQQWINNLSTTNKLKVTKISLKNVVMQMNDFALEPLAGQIIMSKSQTMSNIALNNHDNTLQLVLTPLASGYEVALTGNKWVLPIRQAIVFNEITAKGIYSQNRIDFSQINGTIYDGNITGNVVLDWSNTAITATGNIDLNNAKTTQMLSNLEGDAKVEGNLNLSTKFTSSATKATDLIEKLNMTGRFDIHNGKINGVDLKRAVVSRVGQSLAGIATNFDQLSGNLQLSNGRYQFDQLALNSNQFYANGNMDIAPNQEISGKISADLTAQSRHLHTKFSLAGNVENPKRQ
jgi:uncharacterized protein involved in outer membrane biogenesis